MTRALILAAGQGTRLRPLTDDKPKCLVPLVGRSLLTRQTGVLRRVGVEDIHVAAGYRADQVQAENYCCSINARYASTNMVETLFTALPTVGGEGDLLISYGDIVYQENNLRSVLACDAELCVMIDSQWLRYWRLRFDDPLSDAETLVLDDQGYLLELGKKPRNYDKVNGQYTGLIKVRGDRLQALIAFYNGLDRAVIYDGKDFYNMYMTSFLQALIDAGWRIRSVPVNNGWLEIDSLSDLQTYERLAAEGALDEFCRLD
jgi:choline kinase